MNGRSWRKDDDEKKGGGERKDEGNGEGEGNTCAINLPTMFSVFDLEIIV